MPHKPPAFSASLPLRWLFDLDQNVPIDPRLRSMVSLPETLLDSINSVFLRHLCVFSSLLKVLLCLDEYSESPSRSKQSTTCFRCQLCHVTLSRCLASEQRTESLQTSVKQVPPSKAVYFFNFYVLPHCFLSFRFVLFFVCFETGSHCISRFSFEPLATRVLGFPAYTTIVSIVILKVSAGKGRKKV